MPASFQHGIRRNHFNTRAWSCMVMSKNRIALERESVLGALENHSGCSPISDMTYYALTHDHNFWVPTSGFQTLISWSLLSWLSTLFGWHPSRKPPWAPCRLELHRREGPSPPKLKWDGKSKRWHLTGLSRPQRRPKKYFRVDVKDFLINMFYLRLPGEGLSILSEVHPALLLLLLVPQLRAPDRSGHCRTPTARARSQWQWALRDLNCECEMSDRMSEEMSHRMPDRMSERMTEQISDRMPDRMSEYMSDRIECHGGDHSKIFSFFKMNPVTNHLARFIQTHFWRQYRRNVVSKYQMICVTHGNMLEWNFTKDIFLVRFTMLHQEPALASL